LRAKCSHRIAGTAYYPQVAWFQRQNPLGAKRDMNAARSVDADHSHDLARDLAVGLSEFGMPPV
jgi:hypothetical protein